MDNNVMMNVNARRPGAGQKRGRANTTGNDMRGASPQQRVTAPAAAGQKRASNMDDAMMGYPHPSSPPAPPSDTNRVARLGALMRRMREFGIDPPKGADDWGVDALERWVDEALAQSMASQFRAMGTRRQRRRGRGRRANGGRTTRRRRGGERS